MKILTVDDSMTIRRIIRGAVEVLGYDFLQAKNGLEGLKLLEEHHQEIKLVTADWNMPEMDGMGLLQKMKEDERFADIPVLMITAISERENVVEALKAGAKHYLMKPFSQEDLVARMMETIGDDDMFD